MNQLLDKLLLLENNVKAVSEQIKYFKRENKELKQEVELLKDKLRNSGGLFEATEKNPEPGENNAHNEQIDNYIKQIDECIALIDSQ